MAKNILKKIGQGVPPAQEEKPFKCASIALQKVLACAIFFWMYNIFFPNYHISYWLFALFLEMSIGISNRSSNLFYIKKIIKKFNLVISITLANKTQKVSELMGFISGKARNIQDFLKSFSGKVLIILDFF